MKSSKDYETVIIEKITHDYYQRSRWDREGHQTRFEIAEYPYYCEHFSSYFTHKKEGYIAYLKYYLDVLRDPFFFDEIEDEYAFIKEKCEVYGLMESFERMYDER